MEEMDFPVLGADGSIRTDMHAGVVAFVRVIGVLVKAAEHKIAALAAGQRATAFENRPARSVGLDWQVLQDGSFDLLRSEKRKCFRDQHNRGSLTAGMFDELLDGCEVFGHIGRGAQLRYGDLCD